MLLTETAPELSLYSTPINIDPEDPALPISHPSYYSAYLAKLLGAYSTLGMAEDTWALNEHAIDSDAFLKQAYLTYEEREAMFLSALDRTRRGVVACVFDTTDRVQHMFFAQKDKRRPVQPHHRRTLPAAPTNWSARPSKYVDEETVLFVLSRSRLRQLRTRRAISTRGCCDNGYLVLKQGATGDERLPEAISIGAARARTPSGWPASTSIRRAANRRASSTKEDAGALKKRTGRQTLRPARRRARPRRRFARPGPPIRSTPVPTSTPRPT